MEDVAQQQLLVDMLRRPEQYGHSDFFQAREKNPSMQSQLAPLEHRAFAREWTRDNPWKAVPSLAVGIPMYQLAKALRLHGSRTPPSGTQMIEGFKGVWEGLK